MTSNHNLKREAHARAKITGESYTAALRGLAAPNDLLSASRRALRPGTVTAFISGGGANNVAIPLPTFGQLLANGHGMVHTTTGRDGWRTLPNDFDLAIAAGSLTADEVVEALTVGSIDDVVERMKPVMKRALMLDGRVGHAELRAQLTDLKFDVKPPILWIQDFDDGGPIALGVRERYASDELNVQMPALRQLAVDVGAIVAVGHLADWSNRAHWAAIPANADVTFVSEGAPTLLEGSPGVDSYRVLDGTRERGIISSRVPFDDWRWHVDEYARNASA